MRSQTDQNLDPLSLNELLFFVTRATVGAGNPYGAGEESGRAAQLLAKAGCDPAPGLAAVLDNLAAGTSGVAVSFSDLPEGLLVSCPPTEDARPFSALCAGITAGDWLLSGQDKGNCRIGLLSVDSPQFAAAVALSVVQAAGQSLRFYRDGIERDPGSAAVALTDLASEEPGDLYLELADPVDKTARHGLCSANSDDWDGVRVAAEPWGRIMAYFQNCLVPSNEQSRLSGAGAGLLDED
ncbi:DUF3726 domain-containing protein [Rhodovibrionaceae bacterium A322]